MPRRYSAIARRIGSPELEAIAERLARGLERRGRSFAESSAEELTALAGPEAG